MGTTQHPTRSRHRDADRVCGNESWGLAGHCRCQSDDDRLQRNLRGVVFVSWALRNGNRLHPEGDGERGFEESRHDDLHRNRESGRLRPVSNCAFQEETFAFTTQNGHDGKDTFFLSTTSDALCFTNNAPVRDRDCILRHHGRHGALRGCHGFGNILGHGPRPPAEGHGNDHRNDHLLARLSGS